VRHQRPHRPINYICLFVACFQTIFKFVVDSPTKKPLEACFFFLDSVTVNTVRHTESEPKTLVTIPLIMKPWHNLQVVYE